MRLNYHPIYETKFKVNTTNPIMTASENLKYLKEDRSANAKVFLVCSDCAVRKDSLTHTDNHCTIDYKHAFVDTRNADILSHLPLP